MVNLDFNAALSHITLMALDFTQDTITCGSVSESDKRFSEERSHLNDSV